MSDDLMQTPRPTPSALKLLRMNKCQLSGYVAREPRPRKTKKGKCGTRFVLALNRGFKDASGVWQDEANFIPIVAWDEIADQCMDHLHKGSPLYLEGRLRSGRWKNPKGETAYDLYVQATLVRFMTKASKA